MAVPSTFNRIKYILLKNQKKIFGKNLILTGEPFYLNLLKFLYDNVKFKSIFNCYGEQKWVIVFFTQMQCL